MEPQDNDTGKPTKYSDKSIENPVQFAEFCLNNNVLKFGDFKLKSGIYSPYFFNLGDLNTSALLEQLSVYYSDLIVKLYDPSQYDVIFGAAYKGIPISISVCLNLFNKYKINKFYCFDRKEIKAHGFDQNSCLVGANLTSNSRVLVLDDVFTKGTALLQSIDLIKSYGSKVIGCVVALDRMEPVEIDSILYQTSKQYIETKTNVEIHSIMNLDHVIYYLKSFENKDETMTLALKCMLKIRANSQS